MSPSSSSSSSPPSSTLLSTAPYYHTYITTHPPATLAAHLLADQRLVARHLPPSPLALHIPAHLTDAIATALWDPATSGPPPPLPALRIRYHGLISTITTAITAPPVPPPPSTAIVPTDADCEGALRVLEFVQRTPSTRVGADTPLRDVVVAVRSLWRVGVDGRAAYAALHPPHYHAHAHAHAHAAAGNGTRKQKKGERVQQSRCYMCHYGNTTPHPLYQSLCTSCGAFNLSQSALSAAGTLALAGRTALVTGGRVGLGFAVALRLLRCGAAVVVSSRYPLDAARRLRAEADFARWAGRVRVLGADFRRMRDAAALVEGVKAVLGEWGAVTGRGCVLDVLVNNAAQTLTDSAAKEGAAVGVERRLLEEAGGDGLVRGLEGYWPKVRGGERGMRIIAAAAALEGEVGEESYGGEGDSPGLRVQEVPEETSPEEEEKKKKEEEEEKEEEKNTQLAQQHRSSWTQRLADIPYQDIGDVLAINAFVPLLLIRELLPLMGRPPTPTTTTAAATAKPAAYIINVSSREGLSEASPAASIKGGHHVHTNMSKAALNMVTETEAHAAWAARRVAMNSVDPGFMSAADGGECPIGWADGAARVLWCVAKGEVEGEAVWGRFLKHFGAAEAVVRGV